MADVLPSAARPRPGLFLAGLALAVLGLVLVMWRETPRTIALGLELRPLTGEQKRSLRSAGVRAQGGGGAFVAKVDPAVKSDFMAGDIILNTCGSTLVLTYAELADHITRQEPDGHWCYKVAREGQTLPVVGGLPR
jgi:hypothetical protein